MSVSHTLRSTIDDSGSGPHPQDSVIEGAETIKLRCLLLPVTTCASRVEPRGKELVPPSSSPSGTCVFKHKRQVTAVRDTASSL